MSENKVRSGGCLCGAVRFSAAPENTAVGACHCSICRRWTSGPLLALRCGGTVVVEDDAQLGTYRSSKWAERQFCKVCGTSLFYKLVGRNYYVVSAEAFDDGDDFQLVSEVFIDEKPAYYEFANDTKTMTGAEIMAAFAAPEGGTNDG